MNSESLLFETLPVVIENLIAFKRLLVTLLFLPLIAYNKPIIIKFVSNKRRILHILLCLLHLLVVFFELVVRHCACHSNKHFSILVLLHLTVHIPVDAWGLGFHNTWGSECVCSIENALPFLFHFDSNLIEAMSNVWNIPFWSGNPTENWTFGDPEATGHGPPSSQKI